jgi:hypothetical protein
MHLQYLNFLILLKNNGSPVLGKLQYGHPHAKSVQFFFLPHTLKADREPRSKNVQCRAKRGLKAILQLNLQLLKDKCFSPNNVYNKKKKLLWLTMVTQNSVVLKLNV